MDLYSITLPLALAAGAIALAAALLERGGRETDEGAPATRRRNWALGAGLVGLAAAAVAAVGHMLTGHRPGTEEALDFGAFLDAHPALFVAAALSAAGIVVSRATRI